MYWLLSPQKQDRLRDHISTLVQRLSAIVGNPQADQLFPFVGRKDIRKAEAVIDTICPDEGLVVDPFSGSGILVYAGLKSGRKCSANEWEPYAHRMSSAPFHLPSTKAIEKGISDLVDLIGRQFDNLYRTNCTCGHEHVLDSLFFDRDPLEYREVTSHERLGHNGETITYRGRYSCPVCKAKEKFFDESDMIHMESIASTVIPASYKNLFATPLIENSRINLSSDFLEYGSLFPKRSILALCALWDGIGALCCDSLTKSFMEDVFLSILPQAKYKDYRSKSQDLHVPRIQLREVNLLNRFIQQAKKREVGLRSYTFSGGGDEFSISCQDFRDYLVSIPEGVVDLVLTDPPWTDGNAYFEKAQLYHPWMNYTLSTDQDRLEKEVVVTDAPSRRDTHDMERWWEDAEELFIESERVLKEDGYIALFFRPIPPRAWLSNLNRLKLIARKSGFEPLLSIDVDSSDPSMRIQQSASYVFSKDIVFVFAKIPHESRRLYVEDHDIDQYVFQVAEQIQETIRGPFSYSQWREQIAKLFIEKGIGQCNLSRNEDVLHNLFLRYCDQVSEALYLPKAVTPFSGQLFDIPAIERLFAYTPVVINQLFMSGDEFSFDSFLLKLAEYVENGTRMLINQINAIDIKSYITHYAIPLEGGRYFRKRELPQLPDGLRNILELDPYEFEAFIGKFLRAQGYSSVCLMGRSGDRGVDLSAIDTENNSCVIQCKRYLRHNVSSTPVQRLHSYAMTRAASRKILITTSDFTPQCIEEAAHAGVELINGIELEALVAEHMPDVFST